MLEEKWYYYLDDVKFGPLTEKELKEKFVKKELEYCTLIWKDGMSSWLPVHKIKTFVEVLDLPEDFEPKSAKVSKQKVILGLFSLVCLVALVLIFTNNFR